MTNKHSSEQLRLRVFAGPNGSGKSTVIESVRKHTVNGTEIDFGYYVNADDIARLLRGNGIAFSTFGLAATDEDFIGVALSSGLINDEFPEQLFIKSFELRSDILVLKEPGQHERLAQIIADYLRKKLLEKKEKFSFETVFSHPSKLDIMRQAAEAGYKVYLYFVSTESPEINIYRVQLRAKKGGHNVPSDKITQRYYRSLELLHEACQLSYQVFFFDNSEDDKPFKLFAHFKKSGNEKKWDDLPDEDIPAWFKNYYSAKISNR